MATQTGLTFEPTRALIVVDVQNDFADPAGSLSVRGGADIIPLVNTLIAEARANGALVVFTQDWHPAHTPHFAADGGIWPVHCVAETWGAAFPSSLRPTPDAVIRKGTRGEDGYSGFTTRDPQTGVTLPTDLDALLRQHGIVNVDVCGLATDYCVKATALDAVTLGYRTNLLLEAIRSVDLTPGDGERAINEMAKAGVGLVSELFDDQT